MFGELSFTFTRKFEQAANDSIDALRLLAYQACVFLQTPAAIVPMNRCLSVGCQFHVQRLQPIALMRRGGLGERLDGELF